jgi:hypothetical protein
MAAPSGKLSGELETISLYDIAQLLMLNRVTGRLTLELKGRRAALIFREGRIVNAVDEELREGESAAFKVFAWKQGYFEFSPEAVGPGNAIEGSSESLMLEAARRQDEASQESGSDKGTEARVRERQTAMEALREVFQDATRGAQKRGAEIGAIGIGGDALRGAGDRLVLRPDHPARLRLQGAWRDAKDARLSRAEYDEIKGRLLGATGAREAATGERPTQIASLPGDRTVAVTLLNPGTDEALWLRPLLLPAPDPAQAGGSGAFDHVLSGPSAMLVVCGDDGDAAREIVHRFVAEILARAQECLLLARELPVYRHAPGAGVLAECAPHELVASLAAVEPGTLVLDLDRPLTDDTLAALGPVRRLIARVPGGSAEAATAGWQLRLAARDRERLAAHAAGWPSFLARATAGPAAANRPPFEIWQMAAGALTPLATAARPASGSKPAARAA